MEVNNVNLNNVYFVSKIFKRYENGLPVTNSFAKAKRAIKIEENRGWSDSYLLTVFNLDGKSLPITGNGNIQLAPKPMKVIETRGNLVVLRGWDDDEHFIEPPPINSIVYDSGGRILENPSFLHADYGATIVTKNSSIERIIVHFHDRKIDLEYYSNDFFNGLSEVPDKIVI